MAERYTIVIEKRAEKARRRLPAAVRRRVDHAIISLADNPRPPGSRKLVARPDAWRIRVGDYRILYEIHGNVLRVQVIRIAHRSDAYE